MSLTDQEQGCTIVTNGLPNGYKTVAVVIDAPDIVFDSGDKVSESAAYREVIKQMARLINRYRAEGISVYQDEFQGTSYDD